MQWRPLQQATAVRMQVTTDNGVPSPNLHIYYTIPTSKPQRTAPKMGRKIVPARGPRHHLESVSFVYGREVAQIKAQQHDCLNENSTVTASADVPTCTGEVSRGLRTGRAVKQLTIAGREH